MTSLASQIQRSLRRHIPLIRFKYGADHGNKRSPIKLGAGIKHEGADSGHHSKSQKAASLGFSEIPAKYRRRPLTQDEIDLVSAGGK